MVSETFTFIVDTNLYSGNFEREMCAYITHQLGECGVGRNYIFEEEEEDYAEEFSWIGDNVEQVSDENGCYRPCAIYGTKGRTNDGYGTHSDVTEDNKYKYPAYESVAIYFSEKPSESVLEFMKNRARAFSNLYKEDLTVIGFRLTKKVTTFTETEFDIKL